MQLAAAVIEKNKVEKRNKVVKVMMVAIEEFIADTAHDTTS